MTSSIKHRDSIVECMGPKNRLDILVESNEMWAILTNLLIHSELVIPITKELIQ